MDLKLNVQKRGLSTTAETINEEFTLHYGHIFKGEKGDKGEKGVDGKDGERGADGKSAYQQAVEAGYNKSESEFASDLSKISGNSYTDDDKAWVDEIPSIKETIDYLPDMLENKQDVLTLTTKPNGNIVIGNLAGQIKEFMPATPSGDPMHYAYEAVGAVWNANTGYWELNAITDIGNAEMRNIYEQKYASLSVYSIEGWWASGYRCGRTNVCMAAWSQAKSIDNVFVNNNSIVVASLAIDESEIALPTSMTYAFAYANKLRQIITTLNLNYYTKIEPSTYIETYALEEIRITNLRTSLDFRWSPLLSKESLLYMIDNCTSDATFTITLHPDVYDNAKDSWGTEIEDAIEIASSNKGTIITLASA